MRLSLFFLFLAATVLLSRSASADTATTAALLLQDQPSVVPLFMWSNTDFFDGKKQYLETVSENDVRFLLETTCSLRSSYTSSLDRFVKNLRTDHHPDVVIVFFEQRLSTDQLIQLSGSYQRQRADDAPFQQLQNALEKAQSSVSIPYAHITSIHPLSDTLNDLVAAVAARSPSAAITLLRPIGSTMLNQIATNPRVSTKPDSDISVFAKNGATNLLIVALDSNRFSEHDVRIKQILDVAHNKTNGNFIAVFTADQPRHSHVLRSHTLDELDNLREFSKLGMAAMDGVVDPYNVGSFTSYWPIQVFEILMFAILALAILLTGALCTFYTQSPQRFETPKKQRAEQLM